MSVSPHVSVLVPCFNYGRYLRACLDSIFGQVDAPPFEVIAVNDGSTDETRAILDSIRDPRIRVVHQENRGHADTINRALSMAQGAIVTRIDPDDRYRPHFLAIASATLRAHPRAGLVYGRADVIDARGSVVGRTSLEPHRGDFQGNELVALLARNFICAPTIAARRDAWLSCGPVPSWLAFHDWYFTALMARRWPFCFVDEVLAEYRVHATNLHSAIARDGSEERSVFWLLNHIYSEPEATPELERAKQNARHRVYGERYLDAAEKYFWFRRNAEARRAYLAAIRHRPSLLLRSGVARRLAATCLGRETYERVKTAIVPGRQIPRPQ
jgi:glycosyltransferase involved in cell wall biosynthesis